MRHLPADRCYLLAAIILARMLLGIPSVHGTEAIETRDDVVHTTLSVRPDGTVDLDWTKLYARARVVYVSSGAIAFAARVIDGDVRTAFRFSGSDLHPTVIIELAQSQQLHRVSAAYQTRGARLDVYLLNELPKDPDDLRALEPIGSIADGNQTAVGFAATGARYVALRWTREQSDNGPFKVSEISAFGVVPQEQVALVLPDFSNTLETPVDVPTIRSVSP